MKEEYLLYFDSENDCLTAQNLLFDNSIETKEIISPYPIKNTKINNKSSVPKFTLIGGIIGFLFAFLLILWLSSYDYPINTGGKPTFFFPSAIPVIFSLTVLFASIFGFIGFLFNTKLPQWFIRDSLIAKAERELQNRFSIIIQTDASEFSNLIERLKIIANLKGFFSIYELKNESN